MSDNKSQNIPVDDSDLGFTPPPLADPVITAIFQDASVSGLAMKSLLNASLADSGDALISDVITVTPQRVHTGTGERGYRIDVEAATITGEIVLCDVQLRPFWAMNERSLLYGEQSLSGKARQGDKLKVVTAKMPRVVVLNILDFVLRPSGVNFHQVAELTYREEPRERAVERFEIHHLQLPKFRELKVVDLTKPLHCWLKAICEAQRRKVTLWEVVSVDTALKAYYEVDPGFAQFVERHGYVASRPEVREEYKLWQIEQVVMGEEFERVKAKGIAVGKAEGIAVGKAEGIAVGKAEGIAVGKAEERRSRDMEIALKTFRKAKPQDDLSGIIENLRDYDIPEETIQAAMRRVSDERA